jgi:drug/metabolite transporter (DMT)-like permease
MSSSSSTVRHVLALTLAAASWGVGTVISKRALEEIPPLGLLPVQLAASLVTLLVLMRLRGVPVRGATPPLLGRLGILNPGIAYALSLLGLVTVTASLSVLLWAVEPLLILTLSAWFLREHVDLPLVLLSLLAVGGLLLVIYEPSTSGQFAGIALTLAGVACCAAYTVIARRWIGTADSTAQVVASQQAYALGFALVVAAVAWVLGGSVRPIAVSLEGGLSAVGSGVLYYAAAYWLYLSSLRRVPASTAAVSFYLIPVFGVAAGFLLLGERLDGEQWVGAATVIASVVVIMRRQAGQGSATSVGLAAQST